MGSSLHGSAGPGRSLLHCGLPTGSQPASGIHQLRHGVPSIGYRWRSAPPWISMDCRGTTCLTIVFITVCKGTLSALESGAPPPPSSSLTLVSAELFLLHRLAPDCCFHHSFFFPFLKSVFTEMLPPLLGLALASGRSILNPAGIGSVRHGESF